MLPPSESQVKRFKKIIPKLELLPIRRRYDRIKKTNRKALPMKYIFTFLISMVPLVELRGAIPFAIAKLGLGLLIDPRFCISMVKKN